MAKGTCDFYGVDLYTVSYTTMLGDGIDACVHNSSDPRFPYCVESLTTRDNWQVGAESQGGSHVSTLFTLIVLGCN